MDRDLALLRDAGVTLLFGSDDWFGPEGELRAVRTHAGLKPRELLRLLCETTPRTLVPDRAIGSVSVGVEASLLVLRGNPLEDPAFLTRIDLIVKQGVVHDS